MESASTNDKLDEFDKKDKQNNTTPNPLTPVEIEVLAETKSPKETMSQSDPEVNGAVGGGLKETPLSIAAETDDNKKKDKKKEQLPMVSVFELFRYADGLDTFLLIAGCLVAIINGAALPCMIIVFGEMISDFVDFSKNVTSMDTGMEMDLEGTMSQFAIWYIVIGCGVFLLSYLQVTFFMMASIRQTHRIRILLFRSVMRQDIGWFDTHEVGEINNRLTEDVNKIQEGIGEKIGTFFQWTSAFFCGFIVGFIYGWKLTLVILAVSPLLMVAAALMAMMITKFTSNELGAYAQAGAVAEEVIGAIRTVTAFNGQKKESDRYSSKLEVAKEFGIKKSMISGAGLGFVFLVMFGTYCLAFWYGSERVRAGEYDAGQMIIIFFSVLIGAFSLGNAAPPLQSFSAARGAAHIVYRIMDRKSEIDPTSEEGMKPDSVEGNIEFQNVVFRYPSRPDVPVLNDVNLVVNVGQTAALVGSSGCGKSTTVQLIQRFYDPLEGTVLVDGNDVKQLNVKWLRQHIGVVSQEPVLFHTTIGENIRYGRDDVTDQEINRATVMANAHDFISKLPKGLETLVGERGAQLSGGQKQRIAIARALVRDPRILLLDEATSALDTESEAVVQAALDKAREGRTTIIVAHRLSTVKTANTLYGFKDGTVAERGSHDELMEDTSGIYYKLVTNQAMAVEEEVLEEIMGNNGKGSEVGLHRDLSGKRRSSRILKKSLSTVSRASFSDKKEEEPKLPFKSLKRAYGMNGPEAGYIVVGCIAAIINGAHMPVFAIIFAEILGVFALPDLEEQERKALLYSLLFLVLGIVAGIANFFQAFMFGISGECLTLRLRNKAMRSLLRQDIAYFDDSKNSVGALTTRLSTDASAVQGATGTRVGMLLQVLASLGTGLIIGFYYSWQLSLVILAFLPGLVLSGLLQMMVAKGFAGKSQEILENAGKVACEGIENIRTVASLTKETTFINDYERLLSKPHRHSLIKTQLYGVGFALSQGIIFFAYAAIFYVGAILIENKQLDFVSMFRVFGAIVFSAMGVGQASFFAPDYGKAAGAAVRVFELLDRVPTIDSYSEEGHKQDTPISGEIEFKEVRFNYPSRSSVAVLRGLDLQVMKGQIVALVGSSGCGKSTTVQLLERFYDTLQGTIHIDGRDLKDYNVKWIRSQMSIVSQEPVLFATSIKENIAYGDNSRYVHMEEIIAAARKANIHNFIESLPLGYETSVGEKGAQLSGGQKQRVAIARALIAHPKILLLDEATSALDTESEKVVQAALDLAQVGRTSIVIAHRLSTIQNADLILVIHNGKVAEIGKHSELLAKKGIYYKLNVTQAV